MHTLLSHGREDRGHLLLHTLGDAALEAVQLLRLTTTTTTHNNNTNNIDNNNDSTINTNNSSNNTNS